MMQHEGIRVVHEAETDVIYGHYKSYSWTGVIHYRYLCERSEEHKMYIAIKAHCPCNAVHNIPMQDFKAEK